MKILIADDSRFMRSLLRDSLSASGYESVEAEDGQDVMSKLEQDKFDLILLDIIMPEMDGLEVLRKIGKTHKVVVISAVGQEKMVEEAKELGALNYIIKPFENAKVIEVVKQIIG